MLYQFRLFSSIVVPYILITFIILFLAGLSMSFVLRSPYVVKVPPLRIQPGESNFDGKVIVVGAGAAGMFAAYTLEYLGIDYVLLEANSDFGGRVQEMDDFVDVPLDLGAEWIHVHPRIRQDLLLFDEDEVTDEVITYQPQTISAVLRKNGKLRRFNMARWFYSEHKFKNTTWYSFLKDYVYPHVAEKTLFNTVVETIDYSQALSDNTDGNKTNHTTVTVTTRDGRSFQGDRVIVATPVTVLQQQDVQFIPALSTEKQAALQKVYMTAGLKAWIEFDERFYPDLSMIYYEQDKLYMNAVFRKPTRAHVMALFEVGDSAYNRVQLPDDAIFQSIMAELDHLFNGKASEHHVQHFIQNWSAEPFIKGAYPYNSYPTGKLLEPAGNGRIYFCGDYVGGDHQSMVHGAALTGRRAAQQLLLDWEKQHNSERSLR